MTDTINDKFAVRDRLCKRILTNFEDFHCMMINDENQLYCLIRRLRYTPIIFASQIINVLENTVGNLKYSDIIWHSRYRISSKSIYIRLSMIYCA
jgi:hypothetical protein